MKLFYRIISFLTVIFFTLNCACVAQENPKISSNNKQSFTDFKIENPPTKNKNSNEPYHKFNFNKVKEKIIYIFKSYGVPFLSHIYSAIIDYCVASIIGNLIELKIKNKNKTNNTDTFGLLRDTCCQCQN